MIIYVYGSDKFKKDIHNVLNHSNIKFRLDDHGEIKDLNTLDALKNAIEDNPNNIYLIDDAKIIKKNSLNQKIKFLKPKDGIEQEYLLDNGIGDISVDSIDELSKHIIKKLEASIDEKNSDDIQESIVEIVEDAYENQDDEEEDFFQLDDELSELLAHVDIPEEEKEEESLNLEPEEIEEIPEEKPAKIDEELSFDQDLDNIEIIESTQENLEDDINAFIDNNEENNLGDNIMADEFAEFDTLNENDILAALDGMDNAVASNSTPPKAKSTATNNSTSNSTESVQLNSGSNVDDIAQLISQLLNNKTLEITVKVKD